MLLTEKNPLKTSYVFRGFSFIVDMSFNNILGVFEVLEDEDLFNSDRALMALYMLTGHEMFEDDSIYDEEGMIEFVGEMLRDVFNKILTDQSKRVVVPLDIEGNPMPVAEDDADVDPSIHFVHDAEYIFSSFMYAYKMNLYEYHDRLHWFEFLALLNGLPSESIMMKIVDIREREIPTGKGSEKEARELKKAKRKFALPKQKGGE